MPHLNDKYRIAIMACVLAAATALTFFFFVVVKTDIIYTHLFYIPIVLSAIWWGKPAILVAFYLGLQLLFIHFIANKTLASATHDILRALMFLAIAFYVSRLSDSLRNSLKALRRSVTDADLRVKERTDELSKVNESLLREIEMRKKVEKYTALFQLAADNAREGFGIADLRGNITYANRALLEIFDEKCPGDVVNKSILDYYPEKSHKRVKEEILPAVLKGVNWSGEADIISRKGKVSRVIENIFVIKNENGEAQFFANILMDITDRKKIQDDLVDKVKDLEAFSKFVVERELRLQELERKIRSLEKGINGTV